MRDNNSEIIEIYPGTKLPTIRELVKTKQNQRTIPIRNKSLQRAEDQLMKWQPSINSHREVIAAVDGNHPYQSLEDQNENDTANNSNIIIQHWYNENEDFFKQGDVTQDDNNNNNNIHEEENDSFVITPIEPLTAVTLFGTVSSSRYGTEIRTGQNTNTINDHNNNNSMRSVSLPERSYQGSRVQSLYSLYYQQPIPMNYIDNMCESPCDISNERRYHWDQTYSEFETNDGYLDNHIILGCLGWLGCDM